MLSEKHLIEFYGIADILFLQDLFKFFLKIRYQTTDCLTTKILLFLLKFLFFFLLLIPRLLLTIEINVFFFLVSFLSFVAIIIIIYFIFPDLRLSCSMKICIENLIKFFING